MGQSQYDNAYDELFKILKYAHDKWILPQKQEKAKVDPRSTSEEKGASQVDHQRTSDADKVMGMIRTRRIRRKVQVMLTRER